MARRRGRAGLSEQEAALWRRVAEQVRPLRPREPAAAPPSPAPPPRPRENAWREDGLRENGLRENGLRENGLRSAAPRAIEAGREPAPAAPVASGWSFSPAPDPRPPPAPPGWPGLDRASQRRLARGRLHPEARLDLHGMTAERAHGALSRFVAESRALGRRCVLVVTGKGRGESGARGEGVLRRDAPRWLEAPPLRDGVVGVFEAHPRHGGGGALYVYLKRRR